MISKRTALHNQENTIKLFEEHCTLAKDALAKAKLYFIQNKLDISNRQIQLALKFYSAWTQPLLKLSLDTLANRRLNAYFPVLLRGCLESAKLHYKEAIKEMVLETKKKYLTVSESLYRKYCDIYPASQNRAATINKINHTIHRIQAELVIIHQMQAEEQRAPLQIEQTQLPPPKNQAEEQRTSSQIEQKQLSSSTASICMIASMPPKSLLPVTIPPVFIHPQLTQALKNTTKIANVSAPSNPQSTQSVDTNHDEEMVMKSSPLTLPIGNNISLTDKTVEFSLMELQQLFPLDNFEHTSLMNITFSNTAIPSQKPLPSSDETNDLNFSSDEIEFLEQATRYRR